MIRNTAMVTIVLIVKVEAYTIRLVKCHHRGGQMQEDIALFEEVDVLPIELDCAGFGAG
jgi:hypothetical protein